MSTKVNEKPKKIKPLLNFSKLTNPALSKRLDAIHGGMNGNPAFTTPPVDMPTFKAEIDKFDVLSTDAAERCGQLSAALRSSPQRHAGGREHCGAHSGSHCSLDIYRPARFQGSNHQQSDPGYDVSVSGSRPGPTGLLPMERSGELHLYLRRHV